MYLADIMAVDRQLANEIEFDLRKFAEQQKEEEERQQRIAAGLVSHRFNKFLKQNCIHFE